MLVRFDIPSLAADVDAKRAAVKQAQARLESARANAARLAPLVERGVTAQRDLEDARRAQAEAEADVSQAESGVQAASALSARTVVRAPFNGVIAKRWHNPGDFVEPSASDPVIRLINPKNLQIVASAPVADLARLTPAERAARSVLAPKRATAVIVLTRPAQVDPKTTLADLRLAFAAASRFPVGAPLTIEIVAESHPNVSSFPRSRCCTRAMRRS